MKILTTPPMIRGLEGINRDDLLAEYRCDELGDTLIDYSGNGNHGTFGIGGNKPTRTPFGIDFYDDYITLPDTIKNALSVQNDFTIITAGIASGGSILGSAVSATDRLLLNASPGISTNLSPYLKYMRGCLNIGPTTVTQLAKAAGSFDLYKLHVFAYGYSKFFDKGKMIIDKELYGHISAANPSTVVGCRVGAQTNGAPFWVGTLYYMLIYSKFLSNSMVQKQHRVIKKILKQRGVILP